MSDKSGPWRVQRYEGQPESSNKRWPPLEDIYRSFNAASAMAYEFHLRFPDRTYAVILDAAAQHGLRIDDDGQSDEREAVNDG